MNKLVDPLCQAICRDNIDEVQRLIEAGAALDGWETNSGQTPLMQAVSMGMVDSVRVLIQAGANPNRLSRDGWSVVHTMADMISHEEEEEEIVRMLLEAGADVDIRDSTGTTPLMEMAREATAKRMARLLQAGANPNTVNDSGWTALFFAVSLLNDVRAKVELLLAYGVDARIRDTKGLTALDVACHQNSVLDLLRSDPDVYQQTARMIQIGMSLVGIGLGSPDVVQSESVCLT